VVCGDTILAHTQILGKIRAEFISLEEMSKRIGPLCRIQDSSSAP